MSEIRNLNIVIVGVGGQGTLLASRILSTLALKLGLDVKASEIHGMAQRGGSVVTFVRMGERVYAPMVEEGGADFVLAFEQLEAMRAVGYLKKGGVMIANTQKMSPMPVVTGAAKYPENVLESLTQKCALDAFDALSLAHGAGDGRAVNVVLIGALARRVGGDAEIWRDAVRACVPPKFLEINLRAFDAGYNR